MKKVRQILSAAVLLVCGFSAFAQAPQKFNYQAVVRDNGGNAIANQAVGVRVSIHEGSAAGTVVYQETQAATTNQFGLVTLKIGEGTMTSISPFTSIDWSKKAKYIQVEIDPAGGTSYTDIGTTELISVPYALYAEKAGNSVSSKDTIFSTGTAGQTIRHNGTAWVASSLLYNDGTNVGINNTAPLAKLQVTDGSVLFDGTTGNTPVAGAGSRFMWIPSKKALRAGAVVGNQWDNVNIGTSSVAFGNNTIASGNSAFAMGESDTASAGYAVAIGLKNRASNSGALAFGGYNVASGAYSFAAGNSTKATGDYSLALGYTTVASNSYSTAIGYGNTAGGLYSLAIGRGTAAAGSYSFSLGYNTKAAGQYSIAAGNGSAANNFYTTAFGNNSIANGICALAIGSNVYAKAFSSIAFGRFNVVAGDSANWIATDPLFVVGNGNSAGTRANALTVLKNGSTGIGTAAPNSSAKLEVVSTTQGLLIPRMTTTQRNAIVAPAQALQIFNLTTNCFEWNNYGTWITTSCAACPTPVSPGSGTNAPAQTQITWNWTSVPYVTGYKWNTVNNYSTATDNGTSTSKTQTGLTCNTAYTVYVWAYNACGTYSTPKTLTQTTSACPCPTVSAPAAGTHNPFETEIEWMWNVVSGASGYKWNTTNDYNTATDIGNNIMYYQQNLTCNTAYTLYVWAYNSCGNKSAATTLTSSTLTCPCPSLSAPTSGTHNPFETEIEWMWNVVSGADGYKWNTTNDYGSATDIGNNIMYFQTSLTCNTPYTLYVWAYNTCGNNSTATTLTQSTSVCPFSCGTTLTDTRDSKTYATVQIGTQCWMKENLNVGTKILGANDQTDNSIIEKYCNYDDDANCNIYGGLYLWAEAVQYLNGATNTSSWNPVPTGNVQGICPAGWHLPTDDEWTTLETFLGGASVAGRHMKETGISHWFSPNDADNTSNFTGLPGAHRGDNGFFSNIGTNGYFWSSSESSATNSWYRNLIYDSPASGRTNLTKKDGFSVRCVKD